LGREKSISRFHCIGAARLALFLIVAGGGEAWLCVLAPRAPLFPSGSAPFSGPQNHPETAFFVGYLLTLFGWLYGQKKNFDRATFTNDKVSVIICHGGVREFLARFIFHPNYFFPSWNWVILDPPKPPNHPPKKAVSPTCLRKLLRWLCGGRKHFCLSTFAND
jgi:hypothetical protein